MEAVERIWASVVDLIQRGVSWWLAELAALVPRRIAHRPENAPAIVEVSSRESALVLAGRGGSPPIRVPIGGINAQEDRALVQAAMRRRTSNAAIVRFDQSLLLDANVTLPLSAERSLRQILTHQLERLVPLPVDEVEFEYQITGRSTTARTLGVKLIVVTRASIENALALVRSLGLSPRFVIAPSGLAGNDAQVTLWRASREQVITPIQRWLRRGLEATAVMLLLVTCGTYLYRLGEFRDELQQEVNAATKASAAARDLINQHAQTEAALALLLRRQRELDPLVLLTELTKLVPENMWINQLSIRGRNVELIGYSPRVSDLISRIENHDMFYDPKFRSPITMAPDGKGERFDVSFNIWIEGDP
jgi:general secretion pathway protein L